MKNKDEILKELNNIREKFSILHLETVNIINDDIKDLENKGNEIERCIENIVDDFCLFGAWIHDRSKGLSGLTHSTDYKKTLTKKIRKALGYTF